MVELDASLRSHQIDVDAIKADDFDTYFEKRRNALLDLIEQATGKPVSGREEFAIEEMTAADIEEMTNDESLFDLVETSSSPMA